MRTKIVDQQVAWPAGGHIRSVDSPAFRANPTTHGFTSGMAIVGATTVFEIFTGTDTA